MNALPPDDDPTRALDDFVRRMRPAAPRPAHPSDLPDLSDLHGKLHAQRLSPAARPKGGTLRSGQTWGPDDVVDVSEVVVLPTVRATTAVDPAALDDSLRQASQAVHSQWLADQQAQAEPAWQPDARRLAPLALRRSADPRLLAACQPGAWISASRQVLDETTEIVSTGQAADAATTVQSHPAQRLLLLWPPQRLDAPLLGRWPQQAWLAALPADEANDALLAGLSADAKLWPKLPPGDVDWALAAEIVLLHQADLHPFQAAGLRAFIEREREAGFARMNAGYQQPGAGRPVLQR